MARAIQINRIVDRMRRGELHRVFARSTVARRLHRAGNRRRLGRHVEHAGVDLATVSARDPQRVLQQLRTKGVGHGLTLPSPLVSEIVQRATAERSATAERPTPDEHHVDVRSPLEIEAVAAIARDPGVLALASQYLGYAARLQHARLWWQVPAVETDAGRDPQTLHWDIWSYNGVTAFYYLTPVRPESGAHVYLPASHGKKPLGMRFSSCEQPWAAMLNQFGASNVHVVEGPAGLGFLEDPFIVHGTMPAYEDRLMLQVRYV